MATSSISHSSGGELQGLEVSGFSDQGGVQYAEIALGDRRATLLVETVAEPSAMSRALIAKGILVVTASARSQVQRAVQAIREWPYTTYVAREPGWHSGAFVQVDGRIFGCPQADRLVVQFDRPAIPLARQGTLGGWREAMRRFGAGQTNIQYACAFGLAAPIIEWLLPSWNPFSEVTGGSQNGKSSMASVIAALFGAPLLVQRGTTMFTWRTSIPALEKPMANRRFSCLVVDEGNSKAPRAEDRARMTGDATYLIGEGVAKERFNQDTQLPWRGTAFSTANIGMEEAGAAGGDIELEPVGARLITIPIEAGAGLGVWDRLPSGCADRAAAFRDLHAALNAHHGHAAAAFIRRVARRLRADEEGLKQALTASMERFLARAAPDPADGIAQRRAITFAAIYAAGRLAVDLGVLPFDDIGSSVMAVYLRAEALHGEKQSAAPPSAIDRIRQHIAEHRQEIVNLDAVDPPSLTRRQLEAAPGFSKRVGDRRYLLVRPRQLERLFGSGLRRAIQDLNSQGQLLYNDKLQYQARVRREASHDRVYAVAVDG